MNQKSIRNIINLSEWKFINTDIENAYRTSYDDSSWETVQIPHDWAIKGPFDPEIDKQKVAITQNKETEATEKTGRTGALPFIGVGWYRHHFTLDTSLSNKTVLLIFEGAMSNAIVYVNGHKIGHRPNGYCYFYIDIEDYLITNSKNTIAVRLENESLSSRWYPGAGLYRKVSLLIKNKTAFKHWGHTITTPVANKDRALITLVSEVTQQNLDTKVVVKDKNGQIVAKRHSSSKDYKITNQIEVLKPNLWSPEMPYLYKAEVTLLKNDTILDYEELNFGIRHISYTPENGFQLNYKTTKFKGVCLHHDLGPLGAAINKAALKRQLTILKDMGCNAIRSSHNMPSFEQLQLCDEMGFLFLAESFDEWKVPKTKNGYHKHFDDWVEVDIKNLVRATKNHPCIVMWSSGNEVGDQNLENGAKTVLRLQNIFKQEDPTRPVTVGMDQVEAVMKNGFGSVIEIPGLNYRVHLYEDAFKTFTQKLLMGSETASTVSSRGIYKFPVKQGSHIIHPDNQCSSYDLEYCEWSNIPDEDFELQDDKPWVIGEFVWTGFDYLGEPTPYDDYWPARSSYFGICDLAGLPKDRYFLYRSRWNRKDDTLHILPHWNWKDREGEITPVFVYTNYNKAELFVNGKSQGVKEKNKSNLLDRYRLRWMDAKYEPGNIKVIAYDENGLAVKEKQIFTSDQPYKITLETDRNVYNADGKDLCFVEVSIVDKQDRFCPTANLRLHFKVFGQATFKAVCNGDATSLESFVEPTMLTFNGKLVVLLEAKNTKGFAVLEVTNEKLQSASLKIEFK